MLHPFAGQSVSGHVPRELMGLSYGAYADGVTAAHPLKEVDGDVLRRRFQHLLALGMAAALEAPHQASVS